MSDEGWKRDETPYLVFACSKCKQYLYVKTTQKAKKCLRCGRSHLVSNLIDKGEILKGMTSAVNRVKELQNRLTRKSPELTTGNEYNIEKSKKVIKPSTCKPKSLETKENKMDYSNRFKEMLVELSKKYKKFPEYVIKLTAEENDIPTIELKELINKFVHKDLLKKGENNYYKLTI